MNKLNRFHDVRVTCLLHHCNPSALHSNWYSVLSEGLVWWLSGKESTCLAQDGSLIPEMGRSIGEGNGNSLQYTWLEIPTNREAW